MIETNTNTDHRIYQGDVLRDIEFIEHVTETNGILEISKINFPLIVVLTQDCDLAQDFRFRVEPKPTQDKWMISILVAPLYNAEHVFSGEQLSDIDIKSQPINRKKTPGKTIRRNKNPRYHYLTFSQNVPIVPSIIDFKHYFSVPVNYLQEKKNSNYICTIANLYREDISQRFSAFLSRIGLPDPRSTKVNPINC